MLCNSLNYAGKLNAYETTVVKDLVEILTPFKWATDLTEGQNVVTVSYIIPVVRGLKVQMNSLCQKFNSRLTNTLRSSLHKRMDKYDVEEVFRIAAVLDPSWKMRWCKEHEATEMKGIIIQNGQHTIALESSSASGEGGSTISSPGSSPPRKKSKLFEFMQENVGVSAKEYSDGTLSEVNEYLSNETTSKLIPFCFGVTTVIAIRFYQSWHAAICRPLRQVVQ